MSAGAPRTVQVHGAPVHVHVLGSGAPVLLLHGSGPGATAWSAWGPLCEALAGRFALIAPDQAGFGGTPLPAGRRAGRALWAEQAIALMDVLGHARYAIVGHSMGGAVALAIAAARPDAVRAVLGIGSMGAAMPLPEGLDRLWAARPTPRDAETVQRLIAPAPAPAASQPASSSPDRATASPDRASSSPDPASSSPDPAPSRAAVEARLQAMRAQGGEAYAALFPPPRDRWVADLALRRDEAVAAHVLLVHGARDQIVPLRAGALALLERLRNADLYVLGDCGHSSHHERPETVHRLLADHLETDA